MLQVGRSCAASLALLPKFSLSSERVGKGQAYTTKWASSMNSTLLSLIIKWFTALENPYLDA